MVLWNEADSNTRQGTLSLRTHLRTVFMWTPIADASSPFDIWKPRKIMASSLPVTLAPPCAAAETLAHVSLLASAPSRSACLRLASSMWSRYGAIRDSSSSDDQPVNSRV